MKLRTTSELTETALTMLAYRNVKAWRQNNLTRPGRTFVGLRGVSDILGHNKSTGVIVACEVKGPGDVVSKDQDAFLLDVHNSGGIALIAHNDKNGCFLLEPYVEYKAKKVIGKLLNP
jgi:hypothetical protein